MSFKERSNISKKKVEVTDKSLSILFNSKFYHLKANWYWDLYADAVFCSDVILTSGFSFTGTKGLIHPDDKEILAAALQAEDLLRSLEFRMITTYGEVKTIIGQEVRIELVEYPESIAYPILDQRVNLAQLDHLLQVKQAFDAAEKASLLGYWFYNLSTNETWYSANVFRIHDLPPNSMNVHLNTFVPFIHPEDAAIVTDYIYKALKEQASITLEYRINTSIKEKFVEHHLQWSFTAKGQHLLTGVMKEITDRKSSEQSLDEARNQLEFHHNLLQLDEEHVSVGHWYVNLHTKKATFSDNLFRLIGLRPQSVPGSFSFLLNYAHTDDREELERVMKRMLKEHLPPEMDFRIIRHDGRLRYMRQKAKLLHTGDDLIMTGVIYDVTVQLMLEQKVENLLNETSVKNFTHQQAEEMAGIGSWVWDMSTDKIAWSESFYKLLGLRPNTVELTQKRLMLYIHHNDQKIFSDELAMVFQQKKETEFDFRLVLRGDIKYVRASFKILHHADRDLFIGTLQDRTKETLLQNQLQNRIQLADAMSQNITDRILITDDQNTILYWNRQCELAYELKQEEAVGQNFYDVFPKLKNEEELQFLNKVMRGETIRVTDRTSGFGKGFFNLHFCHFGMKQIHMSMERSLSSRR